MRDPHVEGAVGAGRALSLAVEAACGLSRDALSVGYLAHAHGRFGRRARAEQLLAELLGMRRTGHVAPKAMRWPGRLRGAEGVTAHPPVGPVSLSRRRSA